MCVCALYSLHMYKCMPPPSGALVFIIFCILRVRAAAVYARARVLFVYAQGKNRLK